MREVICNKCSGSLTGEQVTFAKQLIVCRGDSHPRDREFLGQISAGRKACARRRPAGQDFLAQSIGQLHM